MDCLSKKGVSIGKGSSIGEYGILKVTGSISSLGEGIKIGEKSSFDSNVFIGGSGGVVVGNNVIAGQKVAFILRIIIFQTLINQLDLREQAKKA